jgi:hypothetical protein
MERRRVGTLNETPEAPLQQAGVGNKPNYVKNVTEKRRNTFPSAEMVYKEAGHERFI